MVVLPFIQIFDNEGRSFGAPIHISNVIHGYDETFFEKLTAILYDKILHVDNALRSLTVRIMLLFLYR